jgi:hypothetical protein
MTGNAKQNSPIITKTTMNTMIPGKIFFFLKEIMWPPKIFGKQSSRQWY